MIAKCRNCGRYIKSGVYCSNCFPLIQAYSYAKKMGDEWKVEAQHLDFLLREERRKESFTGPIAFADFYEFLRGIV